MLYRELRSRWDVTNRELRLVVHQVLCQHIVTIGGCPNACCYHSIGHWQVFIHTYTNVQRDDVGCLNHGNLAIAQKKLQNHRSIEEGDGDGDEMEPWASIGYTIYQCYAQCCSSIALIDDWQRWVHKLGWEGKEWGNEKLSRLSRTLFWVVKVCRLCHFSRASLPHRICPGSLLGTLCPLAWNKMGNATCHRERKILHLSFLWEKLMVKKWFFVRNFDFSACFGRMLTSFFNRKLPICNQKLY